MSSIFGQPQQTGSLFGQASASNDTNANKPSLFSNLGSATQSSQPQQTGGMFGSANVQQPQSSTLFGSVPQGQQGGGSLAAPQATGIFGSSTAQQPQQQQQQPQQQTSSLFGAPAQQPQQPLGGSIFGASQPQQQLGNSLFGGNQQQQPGSGLSFGLNQSQQQQPQAASMLGQPQQGMGATALWQPGYGMSTRQRSIQEQFKALAEKWSSASPNCVFQHYFYNHVGEHRAPYYRPPPGENESKWEEALAKKPGPGDIPVRAVGFETLGARLSKQVEYLTGFNMRLHEINDALTALLQKHDLVITVRISDTRRRHQALSQRCLALAAKVQVLRNRGYAMSVDEEQLKMKLVSLERAVLDPSLSGRAEEIWARMVGVRERARGLREDMEKSAQGLSDGQGETLDEEIMKKAAKILDDYASQLAHLRKELEQIQADFKTWEDMTKPITNSASSRR